MFFVATQVVECEELQPSVSRAEKEDRHDDRAELLNKSKHTIYAKKQFSNDTVTQRTKSNADVLEQEIC